MDGAWLLEWQWLAFAMVIPAAIYNLLVFRYTPRNYSDMAITGAMNAWLAMNTLWIIADMRGIDALVFPAKISLLIGVGLLLSVGIRNPSRQVLLNILRRFRRFRIRSPFSS